MDELKKLEETKTAIYADIEKYGKDLEKIKSEISEAEKITVNIEELKKELQSLTISRDDLIAIQGEVSKLEGQKTSVLNDIEQCKNLISGMTGKTQEVKDLEVKLESLKSEIKTHEITATSLSGMVSVTLNHIKENDTKIVLLESYHTEKKNNLEAKYAGLENEFKTKLAVIEKQISDKNIELEEKEKVITIKTLELNSWYEKLSLVQGEYNNLEKVYIEKKSQKELEVKDIAKDIETRESILKTGEGSLSLKESTLENKKTALLTMKARLEKELGKSINIEI